MAEYLGDGIVSVKADLKEALDFFANLSVSEKTISKSVLRTVGQGGRKAMRQGYNAVLNKRLWVSMDFRQLLPRCSSSLQFPKS